MRSLIILYFGRGKNGSKRQPYEHTFFFYQTHSYVLFCPSEKIGLQHGRLCRRAHGLAHAPLCYHTSGRSNGVASS